MKTLLDECGLLKFAQQEYTSMVTIGEENAAAVQGQGNRI